ncbi:NAD-dependent aldehyde dehydrogenase domain-containing protein [Mycoplasmopsis citelli]|uniref:Aldehyde dehydrogenase n=1 Tax=Mycoplasmopsis citelli TaxID=171281 RepID=A0A449B298_9BACT|nr:aldehyde dehydrogenase family protein [Mycoplasmopsis citelli]VEU74706.1 NAD-dependent aldehyde dehydrogenase domain-containing protein [Mycoplasmopsis citelli]
MENLLKNQLIDLKNKISKYEQEIIKALKEDLNKSEHEVIMSELYPVYKELNFFIKNAKKITKFKNLKTISNNLFSQKGHFYKPLGKVLIFSAWNYPFNLTLNPLIGAFATGNSVYLSLHPFTPNINNVIEKITSEFENISILQTNNFEDSLTYDKWDFIFFTGGNVNGEKVRRRAFELNIPYCLEMGGKSPVIITKDAKLNKSIEQILYGKILNSGQTCVAPDYLIIHEEIKEQFDKLFIEEIKKLKLDLIDKDDKISKILSKKRFEDLVNEVKSQISLENFIETKQKIPFCYLKSLNLNSKLAFEEIMGPILYAKTYKNNNEIIDIINQNPNPLMIYLFTQNKEEIEFIKKINSGNLMVNGTIDLVGDSELNFGGYKQSGTGKYHGWASVELFSFKTAYLKVKKDWFIRFKKYPYTKEKLKILRRYLNLIR